MKISVFGSGYVGLVQAAVLAEVGHDVLCMDIDRNKVERLAQGLASIYEPGLDALLREGLDKASTPATCRASVAPSPNISRGAASYTGWSTACATGRAAGAGWRIVAGPWLATRGDG